MKVELTKRVLAHQVEPGQLIVGPKDKPLVVSEIRFDHAGVLILGRPQDRDEGKRVSYRPSGEVTVIFEDAALPFLGDLAHALGVGFQGAGAPQDLQVEQVEGAHILLLTFRGDWQLRLEA